MAKKEKAAARGRTGPGDPRGDDRRAFIDLGRRVVELMGGGMGRKPAARIAAEQSGRGAALARKASCFVGRFTAEDVALLESARTAQGKPLPMTMLARLGTVADDGHRRLLLAAIARGELTAESLTAEIRRLASSPRSRGGPRRRPPRDLADGLGLVREATRTWLDHHDRGWSVGTWLAPVPAPGPPPAEAVRRELAEVRELLCRLADVAAGFREALARLEGQPAPSPGRRK